jgi:hypothetical protein
MGSFTGFKAQTPPGIRGATALGCFFRKSGAFPFRQGQRCTRRTRAVLHGVAGTGSLRRILSQPRDFSVECSNAVIEDADREELTTTLARIAWGLRRP